MNGIVTQFHEPCRQLFGQNARPLIVDDFGLLRYVDSFKIHDSFIVSGSKSKRARKHIPASPLSLKRRRRRQLWFPPPGFGFGAENTAIHGSGKSGGGSVPTSKHLEFKVLSSRNTCFLG